MRAAPDLPNVELREDKYGEPIVVLEHRAPAHVAAADH